MDSFTKKNIVLKGAEWVIGWNKLYIYSYFNTDNSFFYL